MNHLLFFLYIFIIIIGSSFLGILFFFYLRTRYRLIGFIVLLYLSFSFNLYIFLTISYLIANQIFLNSLLDNILTYLIELIAKYLLFITVPIFTHYFYSVKNKRFWNWLFVIITIILFSLNHFTLYVFSESNMKDNINLFLNILLFFIFVYPIIIGIFYHKKLIDLELKKFSVRFLIIIGFFTPGFFIDVFFCHLTYNLSIPGFSTFFYILLGLLFVIFIAKNYYFININKDQIALFFKRYNISERESDIINMILKGYSYNQIADLLFISLNTVRAHVRSIYPKIGINSRYELMSLIRSL